MKTVNKRKTIAALLSLLLVLTPILSMADTDEAPVLLGTTDHFAVLAGSAITNTGATNISGDVGADVGISPGTAITGTGSITLIGGAFHVADAVAVAAKNDLVTAYNDATSRLPVTRINTELGGQTLIPGVYDSADGTFQITGTLTLDALGDPDGVFIFLTQSTLITASSSIVSVINSARFCRIFWQVGSSATLGTDSVFVGHILAMTSITANTRASIQGQLLARNGAVTLDNNTIINGYCGISAPTTPPEGGPTTTSLTLPTTSPTATVRGSASSLPRTSDKSGGALWFGLLALSAGILLIIVGVITYMRRQGKMKP